MKRNQSVSELVPPNIAAEDKAFLRDWSKANQSTFERCMEALAEEKPEKFADIYMKIQNLLAEPKEKTKTTNINVSVSKVADQLAALASVHDPSYRLESNKTKSTYVDFQEVK